MPPRDGTVRPDRIALSVSAQGSGKHPTIPAGRLDPAGNTIRAKETQMADNKRVRGWLGAVASAALLAVSGGNTPPARAQKSPPQNTTGAGPSVCKNRPPPGAPPAAPPGRSSN